MPPDPTNAAKPVNMLSDPRVFFAAERTLLAWIRTGLTVMAFGFVVARFGLFLRLMGAASPGVVGHPEAHHDMSNIVGIMLILIGTACMILGAIQHRSYVATLPPEDVPRSHDPRYPVALATFLGVLGIALAIYLAV